MPFCSVCNIVVNFRRWCNHLRTNKHKNNSTTRFNDDVEMIHSCLKGRITSYRITTPNTEINIYPESFLKSINDQVKSLIDSSLKKHYSVKINFEYFAYFLMFKNDVQDLKFFATKNNNIHFNYNCKSIYEKAGLMLLKIIDDFQERDSG